MKFLLEQGNGITNCNATSEAAALASMPEGYSLRGKVDVRRLDELLPHEDIKVMKVRHQGSRRSLRVAAE